MQGKKRENYSLKLLSKTLFRIVLYSLQKEGAKACRLRAKKKERPVFSILHLRKKKKSGSSKEGKSWSCPGGSATWDTWFERKKDDHLLIPRKKEDHSRSRAPSAGGKVPTWSEKTSGKKCVSTRRKAKGTILFYQKRNPPP